jgi:hypothetical protein
MTVQEFQTLADKLQPEWNRREQKRLAEMRSDRKHKIGQGRPYAGSFETMLLLVVMYLRTSAGNAIISLLFGIDEVTVRSWRKRLLPLLSDRFIPKSPVMGKRRRINDIDEFLKAYPEVRELIGDGSEFKIQRPKRKQGKNYTGKSKRHVKKTVLIVNEKDGMLLGRTKLRPGSVHDKRVLDEDPMKGRIEKHPDILKRMDSAWTGEDPKKGWIVNKRGRRNHPLTKRDKLKNRALSKIRIKVEHAIRRVKVFRRLAETVVIRVQGGFDAALDAVINLANFKVLVRRVA